MTANDPALAARVLRAWERQLGSEMVTAYDREGMGGEDFPFFTQSPDIPSVYFSVGGTTPARFQAYADRGESLPSHHSPLFEIEPRASVISGVLGSVTALQALMPLR